MENVQVRHTYWFKFFFVITLPLAHFLIAGLQLNARHIQLNSTELIISGFLFGIFSLGILQFFQMPRALRLSPRKSDLLVFALAFMISDFAAQLFLYLLFHVPIFSLWALFIRSMSLSGIWFALQFVIAFALKTFKYRIRLGLFADEVELQYIFRAIQGYETEKILDIELIDGNTDLSKKFDIVAYSKGFLTSEKIEYHLLQLTLQGIPVIDTRDLVEEFDSHIDLDRSNTSDILLWARNLPLSVKVYIRVKSIVEPLIATLMLIILSPLFLVTTLLVKLSSPGGILFRQKRLGQGGHEFTIYKFRTMREDAEISGAQWSSQADPRITRLGGILRTLHLDELPQLWNIISGDLSFIGPRPERPEFYEKLQPEIPLFYMRTAIRPGLTGWAQVCAGYAGSIQESKVKLSYDLHYIKNMSLRMDVISFVMTFVHIINKFFWGEVALHREVPAKRTQSHVLRSSLFIFLMITLFTMSISAIAFGKY